MFDIGWPELLVVAVVALLVIGPKDLPRVLHTVGKWVRKARMLARDFQSSVDDMVREAELEDLRKQMKQAQSLNLKDQVEKTIDPKGQLKDSLTFGDLDLDDGEDEGSRPAPVARPATAAAATGTQATGTSAAAAPAAVEHKPAAEMPLGRPVGDAELAARTAADAAESRPADVPAAEKRG